MKNIRYYAFWFFDFLKGSPIRKHYKEIKTVFYDKEEAEELKERLLFNILSYAVNNTEFYKKYDPNVLKDFPVIDKSDIITHMEEMFSKEYSDKKQQLKTMATSGSSGTPFKIYQDSNKVLRNKADVIFFYMIGNYNVGDRMYYLRVWTEMNRKSKATLIKENFRMLDSSNLDTIGTNNFIKTIAADKSEKVILAYASSMMALLNNFKKGVTIDWHIKSIFTGAEELPIQVKREVQAVFKCPVMSRYSNQENGMLAQQPLSGEDYFEMNAGSYFFEFLKLDSNEPAMAMEEARIVITDLFNRAVPMIRYDTGDVGIYNYIQDKSGRKKKVLDKIIGRKNDYLYSNQQERLSPYTVINLMWAYTEIKQFQLVQEDFNKVTLKLVYRDGNRNLDLEKHLEKELLQIFGAETKLLVQNLENIPIEKTGKRKYIISKIDL